LGRPRTGSITLHGHRRSRLYRGAILNPKSSCFKYLRESARGLALSADAKRRIDGRGKSVQSGIRGEIMTDPKPKPEITDAGLAAALAGLGAAIEANPTKHEPEPPPTAKVIQLPLWPKAAPGAPNPVLRSALFAAILSKDRRFLDNQIIAAVDGQKVKFKGQQLNQEDLDVWLQVLELARDHPLGDLCHSSAHGLLKSLRKATGGINHQQLDACLTRLVQPVTVSQGPYNYTGGLLTDVYKDENSRQYLIRVNPRLSGLFGRGWTQLDTGIRQKLRGKALALWLSAHYATHRDPYPYSVEKLRELSGSRTASLKRFRAALRVALGELQATGAIAAWQIDSGDLVQVDKPGTITQHRGRSRRPRQLGEIAAEIDAAKRRRRPAKPQK
jgi:TrfA protein